MKQHLQWTQWTGFLIGRHSSILWSPAVQVSHVIVCDPNTSALTIPIIINMKNKSIETTALIDCGAEEAFIIKN